MWTKVKTLVQKVGAKYVLIALCVLLVLAYLRFAPQITPPLQEKGPVVVAPETKVVTKYVTRRVVVPGPERIVYLNRQEAAVALKMPELNTGSDNILAVVTVPPHSGPTTAIARLSPSGEGSILLRQEPTPFWKIKKEFGARAGMGTGGLIIGEIYARPLRIGSIDLEARGYAKRDDRSGADFGAALLMDYRF